MQIPITTVSPFGMSDFRADVAALPGRFGPAEIPIHVILRELVGELREEFAAKRVRLELKLLARRIDDGCNSARWHRVLRAMLLTALSGARPGSELIVRTTCPADCAVRVEVTRAAPRRSLTRQVHC